MMDLNYILGFRNPDADAPLFDLLEIDDNDGASINEEEVEDEYAKTLNTWVDDHFMSVMDCPFCGAVSDTAAHEWEHEEGEDDGGFLSAHVDLWSCPNCTYWQIYWFEEFLSGCASAGPSSTGWFHRCLLPKLREFDVALPEGVDGELAVELRRHSHSWHSLTPATFERLVAAVFKANHAQCEVIHVGKPNDGGADVLFVDSNVNQWLIQAKCRQSPRRTEGVETIRNLLGAMVLRDTEYGIVATTADHFSFQAKEARTQATRRGKTIRLLDKGKLVRMLDGLIPERPWLGTVDAISPASVAHFARAIPPHTQGCFDFIYRPRKMPNQASEATARKLAEPQR
jgi:hypothetical protein